MFFGTPYAGAFCDQISLPDVIVLVSSLTGLLGFQHIGFHSQTCLDSSSSSNSEKIGHSISSTKEKQNTTIKATATATTTTAP